MTFLGSPRQKWAAAVAAAGLVVFIFIGIHTPPVRSLVRERALDWLLASAGLQVSVGELSYNFLTLDFRLREVTVAAKGADTPFLAAQDVRVDLPWSAAIGPVSLENVELTGLAVTVVRGTDGSLNLPTFGQGDGGGGISRLDVERMAIRQTSVRYDDGARQLTVEVGDLALTLAPDTDGVAVGRLTTGRGLSVRIGDFVTNGTLEGLLAYDGTSLGLTKLDYASALGRLQLDGRVDVFGPTPVAKLSVGGSISLQAVSAAFAIDPEALGTIDLTGDIEGSLGAPVATLSLTSGSVQWQHLLTRQVVARAVVTTGSLTLDPFAFRLAEGTVDMRGQLQFDPWRVAANLEWKNVGAADSLGPYAPTPIEGRLSGRAQIEGTLSEGLSGLSMTATVHADSDQASRQAIGLQGDLSLELARGAWRLHHAHDLSRAVTIEGNLAGQLSQAGVAASSLTGAFIASAENPSRLMQLLRSVGVSTPEWIQPEAGTLDARIEVGGTLGAPRASGLIALRDARLSGSRSMDADLAFGADRAGISLEDVTVAMGANLLKGNGRVNFKGGAVSGGFDLGLSDFAAFGQAVTAWRPSGSVTARVALSGTQTRPVVRAHLSGSAMEVARQRLGDVTTEIRYSDSVISIAGFELRQPDGGRLSAAADYATVSGRSTLALRADALRITPIEAEAGAWPVAASIDGSLDVRGTIEHPEGGGRLALTDVRWNDMRLDRADAEIALSDAGAAATISVPALAVVVEATVAPRAPYGLTIAATANDTDVRLLIDALGARVPPELEQLTGTFRARVDAAGPLQDLASLKGDAAIERLDLQAGDATLQLERPAQVRYAASTLAISALRLHTGATTLDVSGEIAPGSSSGLTLSLDGALADLRPWMLAAGLPSDLALDGAVAASARAAGSLERLALTADVQVEKGRIAWPGYPAASDVAVHVAIADGVLDVPALSARWQDATAVGQLRVPLRFLEEWLPAGVVAGISNPDRTASVQGRIDNVTPAALTPFAGDAILDVLKGAANLQVDLRADGPALDRMNGSMLLTDLNGSVVDLPVEQARPTRIEVTAGRLRVADWTWRIAGSEIGVTGGAGLTGSRDVDLQVNGRLDLRVLGAFVPTVTSSGTGELSVAIRGTVAEPLADGTVRLENGELRLADPQLAVSNASGLLVLRPNRLEISRLEGALNGGRFSSHGELDYRGLALTGGSLSMKADGVALNMPAGMRTEVNAAVTVAVDGRIQVSGRVDLVQGAYREPISLAAALAAAARQPEVSRTGADTPSFLSRVDLNIVVASTEDLIVDNNYGRMDLGVDLRLVGTAAAPSVIGRAAIRDGGVLFLGGRTYLVERGLIDFSNPRAIVPELDLSARTRINGTDDTGAPTEYDITMSITGTAQTPKTTLSSDPARGQADIVSLLATGRLADQVGGAGGAVAREEVLGYLSGEALGFAAHAVGLDSIRIERGSGLEALQTDLSIAGEVDPAQRLTISRRLSRSVEVTVSQNLGETGILTWVVTYWPKRNVETRTISRDDGSRSYEIRHDVSLGGPPVEMGARSTVASRRVSAVRLTGELIFPAAELERVLDLEVNDRFDFYRWQQDRDRLRRFYLERGYREVHVSAHQVQMTGDDARPGVALEFNVEPGPLTVLEIEGFSLPSRVTRELERIWSNAIVDVALIDDIGAAVRAHMAEQGYLRANVHTERTSSADADVKQVRVRIEPGPRSESRVVQVTGNSQVSRVDIDAATVRLGIEAWLRPKSLADEIALLYRQQGFMAAAVSTGPITYADASAILPVRIEEGTRFTIGRVLIEGAHARSETAVRLDLGLVEGAPYAPDALLRARLALGTAYARDGYSAMTGETDAIVQRERGTVDVRVVINEGPRQVLETIAVTGADTISPGVISSALNLSSGAPVDMDAWYAGRRRLSQTGLFRRVDIEAVPIDRAGQTPGVEHVRADVTLVRRAPWRLRYGVDVSDEEAPLGDRGRVVGGGLNANLERFGLFGRPGSTAVSLRYNNDQRIARGAITFPPLFGRSVATRLYLSRSRDLVSGEGNDLSFITDQTMVTAEQRLTVGSRTQFAYAYQFERNHTFEPEPDPDDPLSLNDIFSQSRLTSSIVIDTRTDPFQPAGGQLHSSTVEYGLAVLGRSGRFVKYSLQQFVFAGITPRVVLASGVRVNVGTGFSQDLILSERFFAGGANTVRGYAEDSLGGFDFFGDPIPGQATLVLNQEIRVPLFRWVHGAGFVDAGDVYKRAGDISLSSLKVGTGAGLRFSTPAGLFRLDLAAPVPRHGRSLRWYLAYGHIF